MGPRRVWGRAGAGLVALGLCAPGVVRAQDALDARSSRVHYRIEARLADDHRLEGRETVTWTNRSQDTVSDLWFHLYWNAFANNLSTHLWESRGKLRDVPVERDWGWQRVLALGVAGEDLTGAIQFRQPDDGRADDRTVFSVELPHPVGPGQSVEIDIEWEAEIPRVRRRTGRKGDFLLMAHWFPKLGVYEGGRGWNCHQFHMNTEFYGDYGTYDVSLDLPGEYEDKVAASGVQVGPTQRMGNRVRVRFAAPSRDDRARPDTLGRLPLVHGFAWAADPDFVVEEAIFRYDDWAHEFPGEVNRSAIALHRDAADLALRDVRVKVMIQPEHLSQWRRHFDATCTALFFYGLWFGEYPYEQVTVIDPAWGARQAGGMEYPTLFTAGTRMFTTPEMHRPESVVVHEAGHQFWYGLVGNNEFEAAWLDEGFNSYADSEALSLRYGEDRTATWYSGLPVWGRPAARTPGGGALTLALTAQEWPLPFGGKLQPFGESPFVEWWRDQPHLTFVQEYDDPRWSDRARYLRSPEADPIDTPGWRYLDRTSYSVNSYQRPAVALRTLAGVVGYDAFLRGMRHYSEAWRYRHPYPDDFFAAFIEGAGVDVGWYFDEVFRGTGTVDWGVDVEQWRTPKRKGAFPDENGAYALLETPAADDDPPEAGDAEDENGDDDPADGRPWIYDVVVRRKGEVRLPLVVAVTFTDGTRHTLEWTRDAQATAKWWRLPLPAGEHPIASVVLDPDRTCYLDENMSDNQWYRETDELVRWRWAERIVTQYSHLLHWFSSTGG